MRLLILAQQWFPDYAGGTARVVRETAMGLADRGHEVVLIAPRFAQAPAIAMDGGVEVRRVMRRSVLPETITDAYETRRAIQALRSESFDLVLAHHVVSATGALASSLRCPLAFVFHSSPYLEARHRRSTEISSFERVRSLGVESPLYLQERLTLSQADRILVLSEFSRRLAIDARPDIAGRIAIVGGGVDTGVFDPAPSRDALRLQLGVAPEQKLIMSARRLVGRMGLEMLLSAFRALHDEDNHARLIVIGDGELRQALEAQRDDLRLTGSVKFTGRISDDALRDWYRAADLFVLPTIAYEGFGMVTAEALACGTPVVGTPVGATSEVLAPLNRELVAADASASSLLRAMRSVLAWSDPAVRANCRRYAQERLSWARVLDRWEQELVRLPVQADRSPRPTS